MQKKLTVTIDDEVYDALRKVIGPGKISKFIEELVSTTLASLRRRPSASSQGGQRWYWHGRLTEWTLNGDDYLG